MRPYRHHFGHSHSEAVTAGRGHLIDKHEAPQPIVDHADLIDDLGRGPGDEAENSERAIDVQITRLRRKIEPDPREPRFLQTVRGTGYMLVAD